MAFDGGVQLGAEFDDVAGVSGRLCIRPDSRPSLEMQIALYTEPEASAIGGNLFQAAVAQLGESQIAQPEQGVAVLVEFGEKPGGRARGIEQLDHGLGIFGTFFFRSRAASRAASS